MLSNSFPFRSYGDEGFSIHNADQFHSERDAENANSN